MDEGVVMANDCLFQNPGQKPIQEVFVLIHQDGIIRKIPALVSKRPLLVLEVLVSFCVPFRMRNGSSCSALGGTSRCR